MKKYFIVLFLALFIFAGCESDEENIVEYDEGVGPFVKASIPANHSINVSPDTKIVLYFNEKVDKESVEENITLEQNNVIISELDFSWFEDQIVSIYLEDGNPFEESMIYNLRLAKGFQDLEEIQAKKSFFLEFTTGIAVAAPTFEVTGVMPEDGTTITQFTGLIFTIFFSDYVNPSTINDSAIFLSDGTKRVFVEFTIGTDLKSVQMKTVEDLVVATTYTLTVNTQVTNNRTPETALAADFTATYTTGNYTNKTGDAAMKFTHGNTENSAGTMKVSESSDYPAGDASESDNYTDK